MKKVLLKGTGQDRVEKQDELKYKYSIISDDNLPSSYCRLVFL